MLHNKNQLPRLPGSAFKDTGCVGGAGRDVFHAYPLSCHSQIMLLLFKIVHLDEWRRLYIMYL